MAPGAKQIVDWVRQSGTNVRNDGWRGAKESLYDVYEEAWRTFGQHVPRGTNIYDREWDLLVILDACRVDLLTQVSPEYGFVDEVESVTSVGSMSAEWMKKTFTEARSDEMARTVYVTANVFSDHLLDGSEFLELDEVWRYGWDEDCGVVPPRPVTDRAIHHGRATDPDRLVVHYMQPHHPFIATPEIDRFGNDPFGKEEEETVVDALRRGRIDREKFWRAYRENLELVLEDVELLLSNVDGSRAVITADHGDALGEWGIYDHPAGFLHPVVTGVPWVETEPTDTGDYTPSREVINKTSVDVEERLQELGYI